MCIDDLIRTKRFIKGINAAIQSLQKKKKGPIHILYAGTGPYAALILPLLCLFSEKEIQLSLLEINKASFNYMLQLLSAFNFNNFIHTVEIADATNYTIKNPSEIDIVLSETMQHALVKEQQVPITINLINQLRSDVILIPQNITLELALLNIGNMTKNMLEITKEEFYKPAGKIFELNKGTSGAQIGAPVELELKTTDLIDFDKLIIGTTIQVFED